MALTSSEKKFLRKEIEAAEGFRTKDYGACPAETAFIRQAHDRMIPVHRPSWPDYLIVLNGRLVGVEVKSSSDRISDNQRRTFDILTKHNALPIFLWGPDRPRVFTPWQKARKMPRYAAQ